MRRSLVFSAVAVAVGFAVFVGAWWWWFGRGDTGTTTPTGAGGRAVAVDQPLPSLSGESLDGRPLDASSFRGQILVVNAWATWCAPCRREQPDLAALSRRYEGRGVSFLGVNYRDDRAAAKRWVADEFHVPYPSIYDPSGRSASVLSYPLGLPDTYVVDPSGTIRWALYGQTDAKELAGLIDQVLASPSGSGSSPVGMASPSA